MYVCIVSVLKQRSWTLYTAVVFHCRLSSINHSRNSIPRLHFIESSLLNNSNGKFVLKEFSWFRYSLEPGIEFTLNHCQLFVSVNKEFLLENMDVDKHSYDSESKGAVGPAAESSDSI